MAYQTFAEAKTYAMEMLSEEETERVFTQNLLPRWATKVRDKINQWAAWKWKESKVTLAWPGVASGDIASVLYLPEYVDQILSMYPNRRGFRDSIKIVTQWEFDQGRPGIATDWGRDYLIIHGYYNVMRDNPANAPITITASGGADAENLVCRVTGREATTQHEIVEDVTLDVTGNGTTTQSFRSGEGGVRSCEIQKASLETILTASLSPGTVDFQNGGITIETLDADRTQIRHEHQRTELYGVTGGATNDYTIAFYRRYNPITSDSDPFLPEIPNEFVDAIEAGIMAQICHFRREWDGKLAAEQEFKDAMTRLYAWTFRRPGQVQTVVANRQWASRLGVRR